MERARSQERVPELVSEHALASSRVGRAVRIPAQVGAGQIFGMDAVSCPHSTEGTPLCEWMHIELRIGARLWANKVRFRIKVKSARK